MSRRYAVARYLRAEAVDAYEAQKQAAVASLRETLEQPDLDRDRVIDALWLFTLAGGDPKWDERDDQTLRAIAEAIVSGDG
jgi:DnaJ-domain-containing protein 1